jgi:hypothetical protein
MTVPSGSAGFSRSNPVTLDGENWLFEWHRLILPMHVRLVDQSFTGCSLFIWPYCHFVGQCCVGKRCERI